MWPPLGSMKGRRRFLPSPRSQWTPSHLAKLRAPSAGWGFLGKRVDGPVLKGLITEPAFLLAGGDGVPWPARLQGLTRIRCKSLSLTDILRLSRQEWSCLSPPADTGHTTCRPALLACRSRVCSPVAAVAECGLTLCPLPRASKDPLGPRATRVPSDRKEGRSVTQARGRPGWGFTTHRALSRNSSWKQVLAPSLGARPHRPWGMRPRHCPSWGRQGWGGGPSAPGGAGP